MINENRLKDLIQKHGLKGNNRRREIVYKRCVVMSFMRKKGYSLNQIGRFFDKDHSTVIHSINMADIYSNYDDFRTTEYFLHNELASTIDKREADLVVEKQESTISELEFRILGCRTLKDFRKIQSEVVDKLI